MIALAHLLALHLVLSGESADGAVLVMPFEGSDAKAEDRWLGEAVAEALPKALARLGTPSLDRWERLSIYETLEIPPAPLSLASSVRIAEAAGAARLVVGGFSARDAAVSLSLRLLDVKRATLSAPMTASGPRDQLLATIDELAWAMASVGGTAPALTREAFLAQRPDVPFDVFESYVRGLSSADPAGCERNLAQALKRRPGYAEARFALGELQMGRGDYGQAAESLGRVSMESALGRRARFARGVALLKAGRYREAEALYGELEASDRSAAVLNNRALARLRLGDSQEAARQLRQGLESGPSPPELGLNLAWTLFCGGDFEGAAFWARGIVQEKPADLHSRLILAWALERAGHSAEAEREWRAILSAAPSYAELRRPDPSRRLERILETERPMAVDPEARSEAELAAVHSGRAGKLRDAGDLDGALRELTRAAYLNPYDSGVHLELGRAYRTRGDKELALNELRMSLWCREDPAVRGDLVTLLRELGRGEEARREAESVRAKTKAPSAAGRR
jgi:tetratricopeptide (TPR) repeat protein